MGAGTVLLSLLNEGCCHFKNSGKMRSVVDKDKKEKEVSFVNYLLNILM